jgi:hypothetical protein
MPIDNLDREEIEDARNRLLIQREGTPTSKGLIGTLSIIRDLYCNRSVLADGE